MKEKTTLLVILLGTAFILGAPIEDLYSPGWFHALMNVVWVIVWFCILYASNKYRMLRYTVNVAVCFIAISICTSVGIGVAVANRYWRIGTYPIMPGWSHVVAVAVSVTRYLLTLVCLTNILAGYHQHRKHCRPAQ